MEEIERAPSGPNVQTVPCVRCVRKSDGAEVVINKSDYNDKEYEPVRAKAQRAAASHAEQMMGGAGSDPQTGGEQQPPPVAPPAAPPAQGRQGRGRAAGTRNRL